ncbi:TetR family transcriptional regulator [Streptomyces sp. NP160]|uniref:TetR/AcrR family transcriptional regulator n=1 Tax=Streptomyces sp. NP160 TaxID=2586637 RepID=UPI001118949F|nr:TetR/AcrR family transcriptional regulator [Streptomyces sp. NP160]TNM68721.1 TetR family transcriptional regulator [Streptomyces sp. NP160]
MRDPVDLMERRRRATRLAIERAAVELFEEHGCGEVTAEQVAAAAGVPPSTFHRYCAAPEDAVTCHMALSSADLADAVERRRGTPFLQAVQDGVLEVLASTQAPALDMRRTIAVCLHHAPLRARWAACGRDGQHLLAEVLAGEPPGQGTAGAEVLAGVAMAALLTAFEHWALDGGDVVEHLARCFAAVAPLDVPLEVRDAPPEPVDADEQRPASG